MCVPRGVLVRCSVNCGLSIRCKQERGEQCKQQRGPAAPTTPRHALPPSGGHPALPTPLADTAQCSAPLLVLLACRYTHAHAPHGPPRVVGRDGAGGVDEPGARLLAAKAAACHCTFGRDEGSVGACRCCLPSGAAYVPAPCPPAWPCCGRCFQPTQGRSQHVGRQAGSGKARRMRVGCSTHPAAWSSPPPCAWAPPARGKCPFDACRGTAGGGGGGQMEGGCGGLICGGNTGSGRRAGRRMGRGWLAGRQCRWAPWFWIGMVMAVVQQLA